MDNATPLDSYKFHIDAATEERIGGWVFKKDNENHHPVIEVRTGDLVLWSSEASSYREDLEQAGFGNGAYGFTILPDQGAIKSTITSIDIYIDGHLAQAAVPFNMAPVTTTNYRKHLDYAAVDVVRGWVFKEGETDHRAKVEVRCGDVVIAAGIADNYRQDLLDADIGDGHYGFSITPLLERFPAAECECHLFIDGELSAVGAFVLQADQESIDEAVYKEAFSSEIADFAQAVESKISELHRDIANINQDVSLDDSAHGQLTVALKSIAELSVRVKTIEKLLVKYLPNK